MPAIAFIDSDLESLCFFEIYINIYINIKKRTGVTIPFSFYDSHLERNMACSCTVSKFRIFAVFGNAEGSWSRIKKGNDLQP